MRHIGKAHIINIGRHSQVSFRDGGSGYSDTFFYSTNSTFTESDDQFSTDWKIYIISGDQLGRTSASEEGFFIDGTRVNSANVDPTNFDLEISPDLRLGKIADLNFLSKPTAFNNGFGSFDLAEILYFRHGLTEDEKKK